MDATQEDIKNLFKPHSSVAASSRGNSTTLSGVSGGDSPVRRLRRENHLLRLQVLKLREQQRQLRDRLQAAGICCDVGSDANPINDSSATPPPHAFAVTLSSSHDNAVPPAARDDVHEDADEVRARTLQRREARQQRMTSARALLPGVEERPREGYPSSTASVHSSEAALPSTSTPTGSTATTQSLGQSAEEDVPQQPSSVLVSPTAPTENSSPGASPVRGNGPLSMPAETAADQKPGAEDDMSAQAMLQRFHNRKAQRRLRLEQMLGPGYESGPAEDALSGTTPFGNPPRRGAAAANDDGALSRANSDNSSGTSLAVEAGGESALDATIGGGSGNVAVGHRTARVGEPTTSSSAAPIGPTQNPNQIGQVVTDAVKNNSWYLCKVLEAALLDTVQARPGGDSAAAADAAAPAASLSETRGSATGSSGDSAAPQLLYQVGVSEAALRRAIEESLVLGYRCIHDAPQRLSSLQAAEEAVPLFETENKDAELRRCFAGHAGKDAADRGGGRLDAASAVDSNGDDDADSAGTSVAGADDDNLDPFARLLLARISAELPSTSAKGDKKHKDHRGSGGGKQREEALQGTFRGPADGGQSFGGFFGKGAPPSTPSSGKPNTAFVMAAAGGDGKVHIPKKHFSRLDEVQVEMHAPVIFNQIRGFLRLDTDRFRRSFLKAATRGDTGNGNGSAGDGLQSRGVAQQQQQQQRRLRVNGGVGGVDEATAWRISVSPGKSGTTLLYFGDYVMKTVRPSEMEFFTRKFLPAYVRYCERNPHTLLPRFYALVTVRWWKAGIAQHFVLMHNVFATPYYIHRIYDVKGSTVNRTALQPGKPPPRTAFGALLLKDNDLPPQLIICGAYQRAILLAQFRSDVGFLRQLSVVDYSCMIGVRSRLFSREEGPSKTIVLQRHQHHDNDEPYVDPLGGGELPMPLDHHRRTRSEVLNVTSVAADAGEQTVSVGIPSKAQRAADGGGRPASEDDVYVCIHGCDGGLLSLPIYAPGDDTTAREDVYYLGIIDVLQTYNSAKKLESFAKGFVNDRQAISVIPPDGYSERLYKVLERITV